MAGKKVLWNYLGKTVSQKRWTPSAIMCYERHCVCKGCYYYEEIFSKSDEKCHMKASVLELIRKIGLPKDQEGNNEQ